MLLHDLGEPVKEDQKNIALMHIHLNASDEAIEFLQKANGMRNIIVHRYNGIEENIVFNARRELTEYLRYWIELIEAKLNAIGG